MEVKQPEPRRDPWQLYAVFLTALAATLGAIVASRELLPPLLFSALVAAIGFGIVLVVGYGVVGQRIASNLSKRAASGRRNRLSKQCFGEFRDFVEEFSRVSWPSLDQAIRNLPNSPSTNWFKELYSDKSMRIHAEPFRRLRDQLEKLSSEDFGLWDLVQAVERFETVIAVYWSLYAWGYIQVVGKIANGGVPSNSRTHYDKFREEFNDFVRRYNAFGRKWNREIGTRIFNEYLESVEQLP